MAKSLIAQKNHLREAVKMPEVSIVLTSFNHEKYIREAIDSVMNQTFSDFELIIWDDASSDNSWYLIKQYSDPRIKAFRNEEQKRAVWGINKAISEIAMGEYIAIHHSDDMWMPGKLEQQIDFLRKNEECGAIFTNAQAIDENGVGITDEAHIYANIFNKRNRSRYEWLNYFFTNGNTLCHPSVVIRKKCFEDCGLYRYGLAQLGDFDMWVRLCMKYEIHVTDKKLVKFRVRDNEENASGNTLDMRSRIFTEQYFIIKNYLHLSKYEELLKVFPEANEYRTENEPVLEYVLARVIIGRGGDALSILFALELLFHVINDPRKSELVYRQYDFSATDFVDLTKEYGVANKFAREIDSDQQQQKIDMMEEDIRDLSHKYEVLMNERDCIVSTISWRLTKPLRVMRELIQKLPVI